VSAALAAVALHAGRPAEAAALAALAGALGGFLPFNFHPARIFLGDSGSLLLGFLLATLSIEASAKLPATVAILVPLLALGVPIADTALAVIRRLLRALHVVRRSETSERYEFFFAGGRSVFTADRQHIHHRLLELGLTQRRAVLLLYAVAAGLCVVAFALVFQREPNVGLWLGAVAVATVVGIRRLGYGEMAILRNGALLPLFDLPVVNRRVLHGVVDLGFVVAGYFLALFVSNEGSWGEEMGRSFREAVPLVAFVQIGAFVVSGLYRSAWRYVGIRDLFVLIRAIGLAVLAGWVARWWARGFEPPSLAVTILDGYFLATLVVGSRLSFRVLEYLFKVGAAVGTRARRVVVYGAGSAGVLALREIESNPELRMRVVGFLDDDPRKRLRQVNGCPVFEPASLEEMIRRREFDELVVSTPKIPPERVRAVAERCAAAGLAVRKFSIGWGEVAKGTAAEGTERIARP
jgi:UDP-GlcNAc:undecaprenyl-phosphate GlcNAc-1-phosphate transferase